MRYRTFEDDEGRNYHEKTCRHCRKHFLSRGGAWSVPYFCSQRCTQDARNACRKAKRQEQRERQQWGRYGACVNCGHRLPRNPAGRTTRRYCSDDCRQSAYRKRLNQKPLRNRLNRLEPIGQAGVRLFERPQLGRDMFGRGDPQPIVEIRRSQWSETLYELLFAYAATRNAQAMRNAQASK
jgi:hypothetical protein